MSVAPRLDDEPVDTPGVVLDLVTVERNLARAQAYFDRHGIRLRPHVKTHKSVRFARRQVELGAVGITCQKLGEAEVMADGGLDDILISFPIVGAAKLRRLGALARRVRLTVAVDSAEAARGIAAAARTAGAPVGLMVECDTGGARCGVQGPEAAASLAEVIAAEEGVRFAGLMTYPPKGQVPATAAWLAAAILALRGKGLTPPVVSVGGTPDMYDAHELGLVAQGVVHEHRPGTYIFSDRYMATHGVGDLDDCALRVLATVVSRPTDTRAILDAGSKVLSNDPMGFDDFGVVLEYPDISVARLSEEHGHLDLSRSARRPVIGERLTIIPNHACAVTNLADRFIGIENGRIVGSIPVDARGRVT